MEEKSLSPGEELHFFCECFVYVGQETSAGTGCITRSTDGDVI